MHYRRNVTLQEDATRMSNRHQARAVAALNNFIVDLVAKLGFTNLAYAQRQFDAKLTLALACLWKSPKSQNDLDCLADLVLANTTPKSDLGCPQ